MSEGTGTPPEVALSCCSSSRWRASKAWTMALELDWPPEECSSECRLVCWIKADDEKESISETHTKIAGKHFFWRSDDKPFSSVWAFYEAESSEAAAASLTRKTYLCPPKNEKCEENEKSKTNVSTKLGNNWEMNLCGWIGTLIPKWMPNRSNNCQWYIVF